MKVLIFGASGSGTTTLGQEIEKRLGYKHLDVDDFYWKKSHPPFQEKVPLTERNENLRKEFQRFDNVVVSGSLVSWGSEWESAFDLAVFIGLENSQRMARLKKREVERYGDQLLIDDKIQQTSRAFLEWANQYDNPNFTGRSLRVHEEWMKVLDCNVIRLNGATKLNQNVELVLKGLTNFNE